MAIVKSKLLKQLSYNYPNFLKKDLDKFTDIILNEIKRALRRGDGVELRNFGVFEVQIRKSRVGRNPNKPETDVMIPRRAVVKFKAGKEMKAGLSKLDLDRI